jgi:predicted RNA-binding protein with EMAP domain
MADFAKLSNEKLEQEMLQAKTLHQDLQKIDYTHLSDEEKQQWKERRNKLDKIIKELDRERYTRAIKNIDRFFERMEQS